LTIKFTRPTCVVSSLVVRRSRTTSD